MLEHGGVAEACTYSVTAMELQDRAAAAAGPVAATAVAINAPSMLQGAVADQLGSQQAQKELPEQDEQAKAKAAAKKAKKQKQKAKKQQAAAAAPANSVLPTAADGDTGQCTALHCIALHCIALHCIALHHTAPSIWARPYVLRQLVHIYISKDLSYHLLAEVPANSRTCNCQAMRVSHQSGIVNELHYLHLCHGSVACRLQTQTRCPTAWH